jgi:hypothetical protein
MCLTDLCCQYAEAGGGRGRGSSDQLPIEAAAEYLRPPPSQIESRPSLLLTWPPDSALLYAVLLPAPSLSLDVVPFSSLLSEQGSQWQGAGIWEGWRRPAGGAKKHDWMGTWGQRGGIGRTCRAVAAAGRRGRGGTCWPPPRASVKSMEPKPSTRQARPCDATGSPPIPAESC